MSSTYELDYAASLDWFGLRFTSANDEQPGGAWHLVEDREADAAARARLHAWLGGAQAPGAACVGLDEASSE